MQARPTKNIKVASGPRCVGEVEERLGKWMTHDTWLIENIED